jgi:possible 6,7-dihydropteridine reductase
MEGIETHSYDTILQHNGYKTLFAVALGHRDTKDNNQPEKMPKSRLSINNIITSI